MPSLVSFFRSNRRALAAILAIALLGRLAAIGTVGDRALEYEFATLTLNLLDGRGFAFYSETPTGEIVESHVEGPAEAYPSAYMPPAYPFVLWVFTALVGPGSTGVVTVEVFQALLDVLACALLFLIGCRLFDRSVGLLAALGYALFPALVIVPSQISAIGLFVFLLLLFVWLLIRAEESERMVDIGVAGLVFGLTVLARAQFILFLPAVWLWMMGLKGRGALGLLAVFTCCAVLPLVPWTWRNAEALGVATPLTTSGGRNLWEAYGDGAVGTHSSYAYPPYTPPEALTGALDRLPHGPTYEVAVDSVYRAFAVDALREDPGRAVRLSLRKAWLYWIYFGGDAIRYPGARSPAFWLPWLLMLPFFVMGLVVSARRAPRRHAFLYLYLLGQTAIVMAFFVLPRYRIEIIPVALLFAAQGLTWGWTRIRSAPTDATFDPPA